MRRTNVRGVVFWLIGALVAACGGPKPPAPVAISMRCPDLSSADELAAFDFENEYRVSHEASGKLRAAALASLEIALLSDKLDAELGIACAQMAHDLGDKGDWRSGNEACGAAQKKIEATRAKLNAKAQVKLVVREPVCTTDASLMTKCASLCDSEAPAGRVKSECEPKAGRCDGQCDGLCEAKPAAKCDGECSGLCEGAMRGACGGRCKGTCDGKFSSGPCLGLCVGTCDKSAVKGDCKGACSGSCKRKKAGICEGLCVGSCSVEMNEPKCAGEVAGLDVSTECRTRCDLAVMNQTTCSTPHVGLVASGVAPKDREAVEALKTAVDKAFPGLLKTLFELRDNGPERIAAAQASIENTRRAFGSMAEASGNASAAAQAAQLTKCFDEAFTKSAATAGTVKVALELAQGVRAAPTLSTPAAAAAPAQAK